MTDDIGIFTHPLTVTADVIDGNGHVNNVVYVQWMQDAAVAHFRSRIDDALMKSLGCTWVARSHQIEYLLPAVENDDIEVRTWIVNWRRVRSVRRYRFIRCSDQQIVARGETDWVLINADTGRPMSVPDPIRNAFVLCEDG
ncbi:MAG: acyl-CoA thioesterase [Planctomycetaceae bacterium]|nr:acyl-CoA thioesterase [Planctomycetaceae bacterium]